MHPDLFHMGSFAIHSYGVMAAIGILSAVWYLRCHASSVKMTSDQVIDILFITTVSGFVGARILYVVYEFDYYRDKPLEMFAIWNGGIIFYGGLVAGFLAFMIQVRRFKKPLLVMLDLFMPAIALAHGFGRIGCFFNGCCYGRETHSIFGIRFPFSQVPLHPTQLYDAAFCFALFAVLVWFYSKHSKTAGATSFLYFTLQPIGRFVIEFFRDDMPRLAWNLTLGQWMAAGIFSATLIVALMIKVSHAKRDHSRS